jgi:hypothetical protein
MHKTTTQAVVAALKKAGFTAAKFDRKQENRRDGFQVWKGSHKAAGFITVEPAFYATGDGDYKAEAAKYEAALNAAGFYTDRNMPSPVMLRVARK